MAPTEDVTYFAYNEGIDPSLLHLGTAVFDYANPRQRRPHRHAEVKDLLGDPPLATKDVRPFCALGHNTSTGAAFGVGLNGLLELEHTQKRGSSRLIVGKNGSKVELIDPASFFQERVLTDPKARLWFETSLSVASHLKAVYRNVTSAPRIWLLTGIYLMDDATVYSLESRERQNSTTVTVPIPEPTGIAALLGVAPGGSVSLGKDFAATALTQLSGRYVWAAQWTRVRARYQRMDSGAADSQLLINQLRLLDVWSTGTSRGPSGQREVVDLGLDTAATSDEPSFDEEGVEYDEKVWQEFEERVDELMDELGEDA